MIKNNDFLGKEKISKLLLKMSLPATIGMLVMTLYNIVDSIFIGNWVGSLGLAGVVIIFPFMLLSIAIAQFLGIGAASIISISFGEKNNEKAQKTFGNVMFLVFILGFLIILLGNIFSDQIIYFLGASETIFPYAKDYFSILIFGLGFQLVVAAGNNIIRSQGAAKTAMTVMLIGAGLNLILDPIFIIYLNMGMKGAAWATVISQILSFIFSIHYFFTKKSILKFKLKNFNLEYKIIKSIFIIGIPSFIRQASMSLVAIIVNNSLIFYGTDIAVAAYGIIFRLMMLLIMPGIGILQGSQPIIGYNYGAEKYQRVKETLLLSFKSSTIIITSIFIIIFTFSKTFISLFTSQLELLTYTESIIKIIIIFLPLLGFQLISAGYFQSIGKPKEALLISLLRQVFILIPLILILPLFFNLKGIWFAFPIADLLTTIIIFIIIKREIKKLNQKQIF